jgi:hypothetical protein
MRFRTLALALALCFGAGSMVQAAENPAAKAARKRSKQNAKAIAKRTGHRNTSKVAKRGKVKTHKTKA